MMTTMISRSVNARRDVMAEYKGQNKGSDPFRKKGQHNGLPPGSEQRVNTRGLTPSKADVDAVHGLQQRQRDEPDHGAEYQDERRLDEPYKRPKRPTDRLLVNPGDALTHFGQP